MPITQSEEVGNPIYLIEVLDAESSLDARKQPHRKVRQFMWQGDYKKQEIWCTPNVWNAMGWPSRFEANKMCKSYPNRKFKIIKFTEEVKKPSGKKAAERSRNDPEEESGPDRERCEGVPQAGDEDACELQEEESDYGAATR